VYYAGLAGEERNALLTGFPRGKFLNFTLNSNHEAYDGSNGYFDVALNDPMFSIQNNTSYFAFTLFDWLLIGLDSAYYDNSLMVMEGAIDQRQIGFIQGLNIKEDQKVILFTHHKALTTDGKGINNAKHEHNLYNQVKTAFNNNLPDYWYYGHMHNGVVYKNVPASKKPDGTGFCKFRCSGHASIPFGKGYEFTTDGHTLVDTVDYYAHTEMPDADHRQKNRVLNGFAILTLTRDSLVEKFYEVQADGETVKITQVFPLLKDANK
jgi:hypothetical protein